MVNDRIKVEIPWWFIKDKAINHPQEVLAVTNSPLVLKSAGGESIAVKPATIGFFVLLECIDSGFFRSPSTASVNDVFRAVACANSGRALFPMDAARLNREVAKIAESSGHAIMENYEELCCWLLVTPWYGYEMIRNRGKSRKREKYLFGGPTVSTVIDAGAKYAHMSPEESIWNLPLTMAGHLAAVNDCGKLDPARPKDIEDLKQKRAEALEREKNGELHPWQIAEPEYYPLSFNQVKRQEEEKRKAQEAPNGEA